MVPRILLLDADPALADNDTQLTLIVERAGDIGVGVDWCTGCDDRSRTFGENDGEVGLFLLIAAVVTRRGELAMKSVSTSDTLAGVEPTLHVPCSSCLRRECRARGTVRGSRHPQWPPRDIRE